jgi:hypothetical protein
LKTRFSCFKLDALELLELDPDRTGSLKSAIWLPAIPGRFSQPNNTVKAVL